MDKLSSFDLGSIYNASKNYLPLSPKGINSWVNPISTGNLAYSGYMGTVKDLIDYDTGGDPAGETIQNINKDYLPNSKNWGAIGNLYTGLSHPIGAMSGTIRGLAGLAGYGPMNPYKTEDYLQNIPAIQARQKAQIAQGQQPHNPNLPPINGTNVSNNVGGSIGGGMGGGIASSLNNVKVSSEIYMNGQKLGFIKRALAHKFTIEEATALYKKAMGMQQPQQPQQSPQPQAQGQPPPNMMPVKSQLPMAQGSLAPQPGQTPVSLLNKPITQPITQTQPTGLQQFDQEQAMRGNINPVQNKMVDSQLAGVIDKTNPERSQQIQTLMNFLRQAQMGIQ